MDAQRRIFGNTLRLATTLLLLVWVAVCVGRLSPGAAATPPVPTAVTVLFFNDLHGHLQPFEVTGRSRKQVVGGIARIATLVREIRAENDRRGARTVVLVAGDILQGTPMSTVFKGEADVEALNALGVDALAVGNHEFDFGMENFRKLRARAAIVEKESGRPLCEVSLAIPLAEGLVLTVIGVTTEALMTTSLPRYVASLGVTCAVPPVRLAYEEARRRGPVILLSHCGIEADEEIARALPGLAAVIGGHDHILLAPYRQVGAVPIFQAFEKGRYLGRIDFLVDPQSGKARLVGHTYLPITEKTVPDPQVASLVAAYEGKLGDRFKEVIGRSAVFLEGEREQIRYRETALGNFVADIMREYTSAQIALINAGAIRASIEAGPVTIEDAFRTVPFPNEIVVMALSGAEIEQCLRRSVSGNRADKDGGFLQVSGLSFEVRGQTIANVRVGPERQPLEPESAYKVAVTDFLATGGDRYTVLKDKLQLQTGLPLRELLVDTIRRRGVITAREEGRIRRLE